jgi:hypothetical protein
MEKEWITKDCLNFCHERNIFEDVKKCKDAVYDIFSNIKEMVFEHDYFYNEAYESGHVFIRLKIKADKETYRKEYRSWISWMVNNLTDESRILISISIDRIEKDD